MNILHNIICIEWEVESKLGPLGTSATSGLLYLPRVIVRMENLVEWKLAGETEVLGEKVPQRHFVRHKFHLTTPGREPGRPPWKPATKLLSYGTANILHKLEWNINM
jgi:hypothetical protein